MVERIDRDVVHEICTNQVVVTLQACVKELVENSLDAGATRIEVRLRESGSELLEVTDDGRGISPEDYAKVATRHATSKIRGYDDLSHSLSTFGFRGEALAAIAAMGQMTVLTRTAQDATGALLSYDRLGRNTSQTAAAREVGTTISVRDLFARLPVRHREFLRNAKAQVNATLRLMQAFAIARPEVRFHVVSEKAARAGSAGRATLLCTSGVARGWREAAAAVLGDGTVADVVPVEMIGGASGWSATGLLSTPLGGRRNRDAQLFFVNRRPVDPPRRIAKLINDTYHQYNSRAWPVVILSLSAPTSLVDVNVTPDKRSVFLHREEELLTDLQQKLTELYAPNEPERGRERERGTAAAASAAAAADASAAPASASGLGAFGIRPAAGTAAADASAADGIDGEPLDSQKLTRPVPPPFGAGGIAKRPRQGAAPIDLDSDSPDGSSAGVSSGSLVASLPSLALSATRAEPEAEEAPTLAVDPDASLTAREDAQLGVVEEYKPEAAGSGQTDLVLEEYVPEPPDETPDAMEIEVEEYVAPTQNSTTVDATVEEYFPLSQGSGAGSQLPASQSDGFKLVELSTQPRPAETVVEEAEEEGEIHDAPVVCPPLPEVAPLRVSLGMATLEAAAAAKRLRCRRGGATRRRSSRDGAGRCSGNASYPSGFSLASLQQQQSRGGNGSAASLEDIAKFNTGSAEASDEVHKATGSGDDANAAAQQEVLRFDRDCFSKLRVIGQFNLGFIIAALKTSRSGADDAGESDDVSGLQLFIIDQHASDEKFRFEGLNRASKVDRQPLVRPHAMQLTPAQEQLVRAHSDIFKLNGFDVIEDETQPPGQRLRLTALPTCNGLVFGEKDVHDLLYVLEEAEVDRTRISVAQRPEGGGLFDVTGHRALWSATALPRPKKVWQLLACRACRGAIMIGKALRVGEMERVLRNLGSLEQPWNCPHGRPTMRHLIDAGAAWQEPPRMAPLEAYLSAKAAAAAPAAAA
eukprot:TRINITY_DN6035_c0_g1_i1.p1 TRINITY_DN6035_c0_g1~~TRINITY_DN6035_c0_g1_i1.p1  ORF type:complete len:1007 (+),score=271.26 TRINITY_DN6035_c0_g1_i1:73-3021(+)